jgi:hypothetical protein
MKYSGSFLIRIWHFYRDGFSNLSWWGKRVWIIILIKLFIIFIILKLFFFHDFLGSKFGSDREKSEYVMDKLINPPVLNDR